MDMRQGSIPAGIILVPTLFCLLALMAIRFHERTATPRYVGSIQVSGVDWTPEGELRIHAHQFKGGSYVRLCYDESLMIVKEEKEDVETARCWPSAYLIPTSRRSCELLRNRIIHLGGEPTYGNRLLWWNGPRGHIENYSEASGLRVSSLGPEASASHSPAEQDGRIQAAYLDAGRLPESILIATPRHVLRVAKPYGELQKVYTMPKEHSITAFGLCVITEPDPESRWRGNRVIAMWLFIRSGEVIHQVDENGQLVRQFAFPEETGKALLKFRVLKDGRYGGTWHPEKERGKNRPYLAVLYDREGNALRRKEVDVSAINRKLPPEPVERFLATVPTALPPLPGFMDGWAILQGTLLLLALATLVARHQSRSGQVGGRRIAWPVFVGITSLFGFACYWLAHRDDVAEPCPECGRSRPVDRVTCPHCQADWPKWEPLGVEIFDRRAT